MIHFAGCYYRLLFPDGSTSEKQAAKTQQMNKICKMSHTQKIIRRSMI